MRKMTKTRESVEYIENRLRKIYEERKINNEDWFILPNQVAIHIDIIEKKRLVIEFADNEEKAKTHMADDGQSYYLDDYTLEEMFNEMIKEIKNEI